MVAFGEVLFGLLAVGLLVALRIALGPADQANPQTRAAARLRHALRWGALAMLLLAALGAAGFWLWWALWGHPPVSAPMVDRWLNVALGLAGFATVAGVVGGAYLAARYGRRASASISADVEPLADGGVLIASRPMVKAVGIFPVKVHRPGGAKVRVRELRIVDIKEHPTGLLEDRYWELEDIYKDQYAEGEEELATTVVSRLPRVPVDVIGWIVTLSVEAPTRWMPGSSGKWGDKIFVPRPNRD